MSHNLPRQHSPRDPARYYDLDDPAADFENPFSKADTRVWVLQHLVKKYGPNCARELMKQFDEAYDEALRYFTEQKDSNEEEAYEGIPVCKRQRRAYDQIEQERVERDKQEARAQLPGLARWEINQHGEHGHICPNPECGYAWKHDEAAMDNEQAHTCARCGEHSWYKAAPLEVINKLYSQEAWERKD